MSSDSQPNTKIVPFAVVPCPSRPSTARTPTVNNRVGVSDVSVVDKVTDGLGSGGSVKVISKAILEEMVEECAVMKKQRVLMGIDNKDSTDISLKRMRALKILADSMSKSGIGPSVNLSSPHMEVVFRIWLARFIQTLNEHDVASNKLNDIITDFSDNMEGWEGEAYKEFRKFDTEEDENGD